MKRDPKLGALKYKLPINIFFWLILLTSLSLIRVFKGSLFLDIYSLLIRPIWPGTAQKEWIQKSFQLEQKAKLKLIEQDNQRLREILEIKESSEFDFVSAPVISRQTEDWWQQIKLGKGSRDGVSAGSAVSGPGGLLGIVISATPTTSNVKLLTAPGSQIGVWVTPSKKHGMLIGVGTRRPQLIFLDKNPSVSQGDLVSTSPAGTILPPNLPIGVIQSFNKNSLPSPKALVQLIASPDAIDWVQVHSKK